MTSTNYQKTINVLSPEFDDIYTTLRDLKTTFRIDYARGASLDEIGVLLNFKRSVGETDEVYRDRLREIIYINTIAGTKLAIRELLATYLRIDISLVVLIEDVPNYIIIQLPPSCEAYKNDIERVVLKSVAAGVKVSFQYSGTYWDDSHWDETTSDWS